jgi:hypothetical protein
MLRFDLLIMAVYMKMGIKCFIYNRLAKASLHNTDPHFHITLHCRPRAITKYENVLWFYFLF